MPLYFLSEISKYWQICKTKFEILVLTVLTVGLIWTILELTPKSALLSLTILYNKDISEIQFSLVLGHFKSFQSTSNCLRL